MDAKMEVSYENCSIDKKLPKSYCIKFDYYLLTYKFIDSPLESIGQFEEEIQIVYQTNLSQLFKILYKSSAFVMSIVYFLK